MSWFDVKQEMDLILNKVKYSNSIGLKNDTHQLKNFYNNIVTKKPLWFGHQFFIEFYGDGLNQIYQRKMGRRANE